MSVNILNIDTSASICSVALSKDGEIMYGFQSAEKMDHSVSLAPFIEQSFDFLKKNSEKLDAVSVTIGPGSYTGLRIGLSMAKGICYGRDIPLITLSSLEVLTVRTIFSDNDFSGEELIVPMIDARRMEVFTGVYDSGLNIIQKESPKILDEKSFIELYEAPKVIFVGDGSEKFRSLYKGTNGKWLGSIMPHAKYMATLSDLKYKKKEFADVAYSVPSYLKEYHTTVSKKLI